MLNSLQKLFSMASLVAFLSLTALGQASSEAAAKLLPDSIGDFRAEGRAASPDDTLSGELFKHHDVLSAATRRYKVADSPTYVVTVFQTASNAAAYSLLANGAADVGAHKLDLGGAEAVSTVNLDSVAFVKGATLVRVSSTAKYILTEKRPASDDIVAIARSMADSIDAKPGEFPALVQHLPDWEKAQGEAVYAVSLPALQGAITPRPVLEVLSFEGGAEAVAASYGSAKLVIVEFTTPQYAADNDARISERIKQLREAGQPVPSSYQRVGNYAVFVFDAPDEQAAAELASQVKYEKEVRWLGDNPHAQARASNSTQTRWATSSSRRSRRRGSPSCSA